MIGIAGAIAAEAGAIVKRQQECREAGIEYIPPPPMPKIEPVERDDCSLLYALAFVGLIS